MVAPKLRFKEFDGDWDLKNLGDCFSLFSGYAFPSSASVDNGTKWLKIADVGIQEMTPNNLSFLPNNFTTKFPQFIVSKNDYVIALTRPILNKKLKIAKVGEFYDGALLNQRVAKIVSENNNLDFIYSLLQKSKTVEELENSIAGTDPPNLSLNEVKGIVLGIPKVEEQTKIASFLSNVDEKISQLTQKHELLSQYKQGMMQKLFSQQLRFKADDGSEFGEWEKLTLSQISKHIGGTALESYVSECGDYNFISIGNYSTNGKYIDNSQRIILNEKTGTKLLDKDDLVMVLNDKTATGDLIGSTILINEDNKYIYNQRSERIICNKSKVLSVYLWHFLNSEMMRSEVRKLAQGGTQIYINFSSVLSIIFLLPCLAEQNKIANFLSAIDQKIEVVAQQIEQAKQWKKGLLQQMFV